MYVLLCTLICMGAYMHVRGQILMSILPLIAIQLIYGGKLLFRELRNSGRLSSQHVLVIACPCFLCCVLQMDCHTHLTFMEELWM